MNRKIAFHRFFLLASIVFLAAPLAAMPVETETVHYGIEMNGNLVGYAEIVLSPGKEGKPTEITSHVILKLTALSQDFDVEIIMLEKIDPATGKHLYMESDIERGGQKLGGTYAFEGDEVRFIPKEGGQSKTVALDPDVIITDKLDFPFLLRDLGPGKEETRTYRFFEPMQLEVQEITYTREGREKFRFIDREYDCLVFSAVNRTNGVVEKLWINADTARTLRTEDTTGTVTYLTDASVKNRIERGDLDETIFGDVDVAIADFQSITYMKIEATIRTAGEWVTAESLNVPGQKFVGKVEENLIDGIFEIEHRRYHGKNAPPFPPPDFSSDEALKKCLEPELMLESNDVVLKKKAMKITNGSSNSWEAACRLSRWVDEEITYEIPGGSARHTFDTRKGECGSHSRLLTAFCRSVGIPARIVTGCMYTPSYGGSFGQHAWNEVYMGEAGWITVDATVKEADHVDSGHIRLGTKTSFVPDTMKVLDYRAGALSMGKEVSGLRLRGKAPWEVGKTYNFTYSAQGSQLGTETLTVTSFDDGVYTCTAKIELAGVFTAQYDWKLTAEGLPIEFHSKGKVRGTDFSLDCTFADNEVAEKIVQGGPPVERTVKLPENALLLNNNCVGLLAFLAAAAPEEEGKTVTFQIFHSSSMQVLPSQVETEGMETITWGGKEVKCRKLKFTFAGTPIFMWVDETGKLIRESEGSGRMVMELVPGES